MQIAIQRIRRIIELTHLQRDLKAEVKQKNKELMLTNKCLQSLSDQTIFALAVAIDSKDSYTNGHSRRVAQYAREIAKRMGKTLSEQKDIFNVAANNRMLYIIDSNITQEAKEKGLQLMTQYLGQIFPIMDYEP